MHQPLTSSTTCLWRVEVMSGTRECSVLYVVALKIKKGTDDVCVRGEHVQPENDAFTSRGKDWIWASYLKCPSPELWGDGGGSSGSSVAEEQCSRDRFFWNKNCWNERFKHESLCDHSCSNVSAAVCVMFRDRYPATCSLTEGSFSLEDLDLGPGVFSRTFPHTITNEETF